jgi:hypothetical protein
MVLKNKFELRDCHAKVDMFFSEKNVGLPDDTTKCAGQNLSSNPGENVTRNKVLISPGSYIERMKLESR